jgi:8-oxo-dGTP pyrophosphatase MutT (NUDIX family)
MSTPPSPRWPCLAAARAHFAEQRIRFEISTPNGALCVGSVDRVHLPVLARHAPALTLGEHHVRLDVPALDRTPCLARINAALRDAGLIRAWRNETYAVVTALGAAPLAHIERAASRFWGTLTFGAHCNGHVIGADGRPSHLWIARRSLSKATDPGLLDNLVGGGVPHDQLPFETLVREGWEEAGLPPERMRAATAHSVYHLVRDIPEGLQVEDLHVFDLALPVDLTPVNQDGEVAEFRRMPVREALERAAVGEMTVDAALATLDFGLRYNLLPDDETALLRQAAAALRHRNGGV